ncbi:hypothetical protein BJI67_10795 [Acidihalobacter aeolianus]|uniref:Uncharacterized protein n=1 Tax=Acidihalobacter aeolianus TaxID=2792603 RepID=A0A1D8K957_9GAMM|nr:hypothetical protein BJI67_10795 [Acidihalobacter aeolianus]
MRDKAVYQAAETYSAQVAYCHQAKVLMAFTNNEKAQLDAAYDFASLLLDGGRVLPPVIEQDDASYRQQGNDMAVTAQTTWHILRQARIVSTAPNWRNYLYLVCTPPLKPNPVLLPGGAGGSSGASSASSGSFGVGSSGDSGEPRFSSDEAAWRAGAKMGWKLGIEQADEAFDLGLHRLTRDYAGMPRFWWLDHRGVVSTPILAKGEVGVKVDGRTLSVGETVFRLTAGANWRKASSWRPVIQGSDE